MAKVPVAWMAVCESVSEDWFAKRCGTPDGTSTTSPAAASTVTSPTVYVPRPA